MTTPPRDADSLRLPGVHPAPNIQDHREVYEIENRAADPDGCIEVAMRGVLSWQDRVVLDLGAGTGFHISGFATMAAHVFAVEPHGASRLAAMRRCAELGLPNVSVMTGSAERLPLNTASVDICHARFAYFFGPGCERGLDEVERVIRHGGTSIDYHYALYWRRYE